MNVLLRQGWRSYVIVRSVVLSVSRITHERGNERRPNMVGTGQSHRLEIYGSGYGQGVIL